MIGAAIVSRFRVEARLGQGGMGEVYRAWDTLLARPVALKWIRHERRDDASAIGRFVREARAAAGLRHPNIVTIYDLGTEPEGSYLVMELLDGRPLGTAMEDASYSVFEKLGWLREVGAALAAAHAAGIVHRDIKPSNVVLCRDGHVKVVDFGLAKRFGLEPLASTSTSAAAWTAPGVVVGTPLYMAPEQARGDDTDPRVDQFAWGAVGYELVHRLRWTPALREQAGPAGTLADVMAVLRRATEPEPADRFPSMAEAVRALDASLGGAPAGPRAPDLPTASGSVDVTLDPAMRASGWFCPRCGLQQGPRDRCPRDQTPLHAVTELLGTTAGSYTLVERVGRGGMGDVFRAVNPTLGSVVAIKVVNVAAHGDTDAARFVPEARAVNRIAHDGVVKILDGGHLEGGRPYLVMELLEGESLARLLARGPLAPARALAILDEVLDVVAAAHTARIVHRDLKPENIFLVKSGRVRLLDFGVAKLLDEAESVTRTGAMVGTPHYMAPEQIQAGQVDHRTDLYALGVILFEMLAGMKPFDGPTAFAIVQAHVGAPIPRLPPGVVPHLDAVVARALAKRPEDRFASAQEMRAALPTSAVAVAGSASTSHPAPDARRAAKRIAAFACVLAVVAVTVVAIALVAWPRDEDRAAAVAQVPASDASGAGGSSAVSSAVTSAGAGSSGSAGSAGSSGGSATSDQTRSAAAQGSGSAVGSASGSAVGSASGSAARATEERMPAASPKRMAPQRIKYGAPLSDRVADAVLWGECPECDGEAFLAQIRASHALFAPCFASTIYDPPLHSDPKFEIAVAADGTFGAVSQWHPRPPHPKLGACIERAMGAVPLVKRGGGPGKVAIDFSAACRQAFADGRPVYDRCAD